MAGARGDLEDEGVKIQNPNYSKLYQNKSKIQSIKFQINSKF